MKIKKASKLLLTALLAVCIASFGNSSLSVISAKGIDIIPAHMAPGTVIEYDKDCKMQIIKEGLKPSDKLDKEDLEQISYERKMKAKLQKENPSILNELPFLPEVQPGLKVFYDGMGQPSVMKLNGKPFSDNRILQKKENVSKIRSKNIDIQSINSADSFYDAFGLVTWYEGIGEVGSDRTTLTEKDCATKIGVDVPPAGTAIHLFTDYEDKRNYSDIVYKYDTGTLPGAILDIMRPEMQNVFHVPAGYTSSGIAYGRFEEYYYHN